MKTYQFTLILAGIDQVTDEAANDLYQAGCEDGTFCARDGIAYIHFDRAAPALEEAIRTAIDDVRHAGFDVTHVETEEYATIHRLNQQLTKVRG
jgi:hypothetical protein